MLLRERPIGDTDKGMINAGVIARTLANDWGFWRTVTGNLQVLNEHMDEYLRLSADDRSVVHGRIRELQERIEKEPKSVRWKARGRIGERVKWYKDVEELLR
jgi:hypothetical protein